MIDYNLAEQEVRKILGSDKSGHGMDHILTVIKNAKKIMSSLNEDFNEEIVLLACYLHDVDDYKIVGQEQADNLTNTNNILNKLSINDEMKQKIIHIMENMGYSKYISGVRPKTIEGMIVSDADMLDLGANGIVRCLEYGFKCGRDIFNVNRLPLKDLDIETYKTADTPSINHFFEKLLLIKDLMMTIPGKEMAEKRHLIMVSFLENFFEERYENCSEWIKLLEEYK